MNRILFLSLICVLFLTNCRTVDILYTAPMSNDIKEDQEGHYSYENDTIKVTYTFWGQNGVMSMLIENKLDVPIYLDWKKSFYVSGKTKMNYYSENMTTKNTTASANAPFLYNSAFDWAHWYPVNLGVSVSNGTIEKEERIAVIPPHAQTGFAKYKLTPSINSINFKDAEKKEVLVERTTRKIKARIVTAEKGNSSIFFSNFLTYSTKESFEHESYANNGFYVRKIMNIRPIWYDSFIDAKRFYIYNVE